MICLSFDKSFKNIDYCKKIKIIKLLIKLSKIYVISLKSYYKYLFNILKLKGLKGDFLKLNSFLFYSNSFSFFVFIGYLCGFQRF